MTPLPRIYVEITNVCNRSCSFCPGTSRPPAYMRPEDFAALRLGAYAEQVCLHVLGEPLLHPRLAEFLELCAAGPAVNLTTNGTLIARHAPTLLAAPTLRQINFSLQALLRDNDLDQEILEDILAFTRAARDMRPELYINLRLWTASTLHDPQDTLTTRVLHDIGRALGLSCPTLPAGRKSRRLTGRIYLHRDTVFSWPGTAGMPSRTRGFCHALSTHCAILVDGTVCPCCLDGDGRMALGNAFATPLEEILATPRAKAMAAGFASSRLVEPTCQSCDYCRRFTPRPNSSSHS